MTPEFFMHLITSYPLTTPLVYLTGQLDLSDVGGRTLDAWPDIRQIVEILT